MALARLLAGLLACWLALPCWLAGAGGEGEGGGGKGELKAFNFIKV